LVDKVFEFRHQKVREHLGGIYDFLQRRNLSSLREIERKARTSEPEAKVPEESRASNKAQYQERKALDKKIRKISNRIKSLEHEIEQIEDELARMDELLMNPDNVTGMQVYEDYEQLKTRHDEALASWEKKTIQLEKTSGKRN
ncbi:MAG: hypothetical protein KAT15_02630, partial [Bacteroidales bacterium]|nr:hypothetical protein [Bacteroidales bacterium]